jgi:hypothetical protein
MKTHEIPPIRVLLDHSILTNDTRLYTVKEDPPPSYKFGNKVLGVRRVPAASSPVRERELVAIYTVARLIREGSVLAHTSSELFVEALKDAFPAPLFRATSNCRIDRVPVPIERAKFVRCPLEEFVRKGKAINGKADKSESSQLSFLSGLIDLGPEGVEKIVSRKALLGLTGFECESLQNLGWFKTMRARAQSDQHLPDLFHLWTALRNQIEVFLTVDEKLIRMVQGIEQEKSGFRVGIKVLSPLEFLKTRGVTQLDRFECEYDHFYWLQDVPGMF